LDDAAKNATARIILDGIPGQAQAPAPRRPPTRITPATVDAASKDKTSRIVLDMPPAAAGSKPPTRLGLAKPAPDMLDEATKNKTTRIVLSDSDAPPAQKSKTGNVSLLPPEIANADTVVAAPRGSGAKKSTTRVVDLGPAEPGKRATSRIILDDMEPDQPAQAKRSTAPISAPGQAAPGAGPKTIRLKRPTGAIMVPREPAADAPSTVKTIKLTKPGAAAAVPPTLVASAPGKPRKETAQILVEGEGQEAETAGPKRSTARIESVEDDASQPETIRLRRPSTIVAVTPGGLQAPKTGAKTETTRIELVKPEDQAPVTQRRTVKLLRPDLKKEEPKEQEEEAEGTKKKPADLRPVDILPGGKKRKDAEADEDEGMHVAFSILSVAAVLVLGLVTYVLAAQAFAPDFTLPIPAFLL
jgi:hypothetical protein